jgi:ABC-2 type transport system ATP-binding protein
MEHAVAFRNVTKRFKQKTAVHDLSFTIEPGTVVSLLGPNGAGKTTSISMMLGLTRPTSGTVRLFGQDPTHPVRRRYIGAMLQQVNLPPGLTVEQCVNLFRSYYPTPLPPNTLMDMSGLAKEAKRRADRLSGGQLRRLQYAIAMAGNPKLLFLDEPTTAMDVTSRRAFWDQLRHFAAQHGKTVIFTTHHLDEADGISDRILLIHEGKLIADGSPTHIKNMTGNRYVSFIAGPLLQEESLRALPFVEHVEKSGRKVRVRTKDSDALLRALIMGGYDASQFEVTAGALEDAFVSLT